ncbi:MAG TPA: aminoacyl-tRNA hydrolase [Rubricoccaceae bacterium]|jgi:PTH1 family peptidyl-tRNA hydrolase|nr:aminoacyl-tRNA hydrolase [Rubricoccaceae bacterium]
MPWPFRTPRSAPPTRVERLVVGLGNPGPDYEGTRHNVGFAVVDRVAEKVGGVTWGEAAHALVAEAGWRGRRLALAKPMTFMNRSGQAYRALLRRYGLEPADALVVYDDLALPVGALRLREKGSAGGHNGVQSIGQYLNSMDFPRLRVGIGDSFPRGGQVRYVLEPFDDEQRPAVAEAVEAAAEAALVFVCDGLAAAMNQFNRRG